MDYEAAKDINSEISPSSVQNRDSAWEILLDTWIGLAILASIAVLNWLFGSDGFSPYSLGLIAGRTLTSAAIGLPIFLLIRYTSNWGRTLNSRRKLNIFLLATSTIYILQLLLLVIVPSKIENLQARDELAYTESTPATDALPESSRTPPADAQAEIAKVDLAHPGWRDTVNTAEFRAWLQAQPQSVRELTNSDYARDAILLLDIYKAKK